MDKGVKVFNTGDEFLVHAFKAHLIANTMPHLGITSVDDPIDHSRSEAWLQETAEVIVKNSVMPAASKDPVFDLHRSFLYHSFRYIDLREAIRWAKGEQIVRHWKYWLPIFLSCGCTNYAKEAVHHIANLTAVFPKHMAYIAIHNRTANMSGKPGRAKPLDQLIEHYNL